MNIVLIVLDTLREDYSRPVWRALKGLGFVRYRAIAPSFWTIPSHVSMFTGLYPSAHGVHATREKKYLELRFKGDNFVDWLKDRGYKVNWLTANAWVSPAFGFPDPDFLFIPRAATGQRLFELSEEEDRFRLKELVGLSKLGKVRKTFLNRKFALLFKMAANYAYNTVNKKLSKGWPFEKGGREILEQIKQLDLEGPHFTFINLMEVHEPYRGADIAGKVGESGLPITIDFSIKDGEKKELVKKLKREYVEEVKYMTNLLQEIVEQFKDALIIVTSDHGQVLGERDALFHVWGLWDELVRVPLFVRYPHRIKAAKQREVVSLTRIRPLVERAVERELNDDSFLYGVAFSELFGTYLKHAPKTREGEKLLEKRERRMVAAFSGESRVVYDFTEEKTTASEGKTKELEELAIQFGKQHIMF